jgi:hypothetical protein
MAMGIWRRPEAAACLLGERMQYFLDTRIGLDDLFGSSRVSLLEEMLGEAGTSAERFACMEACRRRNWLARPAFKGLVPRTRLAIQRSLLAISSGPRAMNAAAVRTAQQATAWSAPDDQPAFLESVHRLEDLGSGSS